MGVSICLVVVLIETLDLDTEKKLVSTIKISRSRSRNLNFVSTPPYNCNLVNLLIDDKPKMSCIKQSLTVKREQISIIIQFYYGSVKASNIQ